MFEARPLSAEVGVGFITVFAVALFLGWEDYRSDGTDRS